MNKKYLLVCEALDEYEDTLDAIAEDAVEELTLDDPATAAYVRNNPAIHRKLELGTGANIRTAAGKVVPFRSGITSAIKAPTALSNVVKRNVPKLFKIA